MKESPPLVNLEKLTNALTVNGSRTGQKQSPPRSLNSEQVLRIVRNACYLVIGVAAGSMAQGSIDANKVIHSVPMTQARASLLKMAVLSYIPNMANSDDDEEMSDILSDLESFQENAPADPVVRL